MQAGVEGSSKGSVQDSSVLGKVDMFLNRMKRYAIEESLHFIEQLILVGKNPEVLVNSFHSHILMSIVEDDVLEAGYEHFIPLLVL